MSSTAAGIEILRPSLIIDGKEVQASDGATVETVSPATNEVIGVVPKAGLPMRLLRSKLLIGLSTQGLGAGSHHWNVRACCTRSRTYSVSASMRLVAWKP